MKKSKLLAILLCAVMLTAMLPVTAQAQERVTAYIEADITTDTTWSVGDYYICKVGNNSPQITGGATLTIEDGCNIYFSTLTTTAIPGTENTTPKYPYSSLRVSNGSLVVEGGSEGVTFTTVPDTATSGTTWQTAGWNSIEAIGAGASGATSLSFTNCTFEYSGFNDYGTLYGTQTNGMNSDVSISASGCTFRNPKADATAIRYNNGSNTTGSGTISVTNSDFAGYGRGVQVEENGEDNVNTTVTGCTFSNMSIRPLEINGGQSATVTGCTFSDFVGEQHDGAVLIFDNANFATGTEQTVTFTGNTFNYGAGTNIYPIVIGARSQINENATTLGNTFGENYPAAYRYIRLSNAIGGDGKHRDAVWGETGIPYLLTDGLTVYGTSADDLSTLTIKPGVTVCLGDGTGTGDNLTVRGSLTAIGTADKPITFTKKEGLTYGAEIYATNQLKGAIVLKYCVIEGLYRGIDINSPGAEGSNVLLENCTVRDNQYPMLLAGKTVTVKDCAIIGKGIETGGGNYTGSITIVGCTLTGGTDSGIGVNINNSRRNVLKNCLITGYSSYGVRVENYGSTIENGASLIENSTISGNSTGVFFYRGNSTAYGAFIKNSIIYGNTVLDLTGTAYESVGSWYTSYYPVTIADGSISYSLIGDDGAASLTFTDGYNEHPTLGKIAPIPTVAYANRVLGAPLFASTSDFHLKSTEGRWNGTAWVTDSATSPCIDAGDPSSAFANEPAPNGRRINLGYYGNTAEASKSSDVTPPNTVATPTFDPPAGTYTNAQMVTLSCSTDGATIRFTTDGTEPDESSSTFNAGMHIPVAATTTIKAKAFKTDMTASAVATATYTIIAPPPGTAIDFTSAIANGGSSATTTKITLTFDAPVDGIGTDDITLTDTGNTGARATALLSADAPNVYELTLTGVTKGGSINLDICKDGFTFTPTNRDVTVFYYTPPTPPDPPSPPTPPPPVVSDPMTEGDTTTVTTEIRTTISGSTANATVPSGTANSAVSGALEAAQANGTAPVVEIIVDVPAKADSVAVTIPTAPLETLSDNKDAVLTVNSDVGGVTLDSAALSAIGAQAGNNVTIRITPVGFEELTDEQKDAVGDAPVFDVSIVSGGVSISDLDGGEAIVSIAYELAEGQDAAGIVVYYLDDEGKLHECAAVYDHETGMVSFTVKHFSKYVIGYDELLLWENPFADVAEGAWYYYDVAFANMNGLFEGTSATTFAPETPMSRAMLVTVLWRMESEPVINYAMSFSDVADGQWYTEAIRWAAGEKLVEGYGGKFSPDEDLTREQMATILYRYAYFKGYDMTAAADLSKFTDEGKISTWALSAMRWANANGLINGVGNDLLDPSGNAQRCQVAAILHRFCENIVK